MSDIKLKLANGRSVTGAAFFNRTNEMQLLQERIENGSHILLTGQRRMGKRATSIIISRYITQRSHHECANDP